MPPPVYTQAVQAAFARFWAAYPHRPVNPRAPALAVFAKLVKAGEAADDLIAAAGRYAAVVKAEGIDPVSIPHARKWLNQRFFDDYLTPDVPASAEPAQPAPEHPLAWMQPTMAASAYASWIAPLTLTTEGDLPTITARTAFALNRVQDEYGRQIQKHYGRVGWRVAADPQTQETHPC